jgi:CRISPR-associated endoribonuclease Cas6
MPTRWEITLPGVQAANVRLEHLHALVSSWLDEPDGHHATAKPYSVAPPRAVGGTTVIEIGLLVDALADRLAACAAVGARVRLGSTFSCVASTRRVAALDWQPAGEGTDARAWVLRFVSPTTFRRRNAFTPTPSLQAILGSLRRTWRMFRPADVADVILDLTPEPVWLTDIHVDSQVLRVDNRIVSGFVGWLRFVCDPDDGEVADAVDRLVALAPYAGVGAYTTRGFGVTRCEPTRPQPGHNRRDRPAG